MRDAIGGLFSIQAIVIFMIVVGLITTFSAMVPREIRAGINPIGIILKQLLFIGIGTFGMLFISKKRYKQLLRYAVPFACAIVAVSPEILTINPI